MHNSILVPSFESVILFKAKAQNIIRYLCLQAERNKQKVDEERGEDPDVCATLTQPDTTVKPAKVKDKPQVHTSMSMEEEVSFLRHSVVSQIKVSKESQETQPCNTNFIDHD